MKQLYTCTIVAALSLGCAASLQAKMLKTNVLNKDVVKHSTELIGLPGGATEMTINGSDQVMSRAASSRAIPMSEFDGRWEFDLGDKLLEGSSGTSFEAFFYATITGNTIVFTPEDDELYPIVATYNSSTNKMDFNRVYAGAYEFETGVDGQTEQLYVYIEPILLGQDGISPFSLPYNEVRQGVNINGGQGLLWAVYQNESGEGAPLGYVAGYVLYGGNNLRPVEWEYYSTGSYRENIAYNFYFGTENTTFVDVEVYKHPKFDHVYKVMDAFKHTYTSGRQKGMPGIPDGESPAMILDGTNPKNVLIELQPIGIITTLYYGGYYDTEFYYYNYGWWWDYYANNDISTGYDTSSCATLTTDAEGTVKIHIPALSCAMVDVVMNDASFGSECDSELYIMNPAGIEKVTVDNINAPVEYYNLQGVRVDNPESGQLLIRKQGTNVCKVLAK